MNAPETPLQPVESFGAARAVAEQMARKQVGRFSSDQADSLLSVTSLRENGCWFFFAHEGIEIPRVAENNLVFTAYAISPCGRHGLVYDFRPDIQKMTEYARVWSLHSIGENELAKKALADFLKEYPPKSEA